MRRDACPRHTTSDGAPPRSSCGRCLKTRARLPIRLARSPMSEFGGELEVDRLDGSRRVGAAFGAGCRPAPGAAGRRSLSSAARPARHHVTVTRRRSSGRVRWSARQSAATSTGWPRIRADRGGGGGLRGCAMEGAQPGPVAGQGRAVLRRPPWPAAVAGPVCPHLAAATQGCPAGTWPVRSHRRPRRLSRRDAARSARAASASHPRRAGRGRSESVSS